MMKNLTVFKDFINYIANNFGDRDAFQVRSSKGYKSISYNQFREDVFNVSAWLYNCQKSDSKIAVLGENSYGWVVSYLGTVVSGNVIVPIDKELSATEIENIIKQADIKTIFCSDDYLEDVIDQFEGQYKVVNITNNDCDKHIRLCNVLSEGANLRGENKSFGQNENDDNDVSTIVFTSGTTGFSKGVMLTRRNLITNIINSDAFITLKGKAFSILPMNHTYEFTLGVLLMLYKGIIVSINNSLKNVSQNIDIFKPTLIIMVPLVAENLMTAIWNKIEAQGKFKSVNLAIKVSNALLSVGIDVRRKLFKKIIDGLGGNLEQIFVGGSFLNPKVAMQYQDFGIKVNIGYGITECSPFVSGNITGKKKCFSSCGIAIPNVQLKIDDPNDNGEGEICVKGDNVMKGYYMNQQATAEVLKDGWFLTGDLGRMDKDGMLYITGRRKNLIVLNNGKNVYPEELEFIIANANNNITEIIVKGNERVGEETNLIAEIFIHPDIVKANADVRNQIQKTVENINDQLPYFKRITNVEFRDIEFPKTTTKKIKRFE